MGVTWFIGRLYDNDGNIHTHSSTKRTNPQEFGEPLNLHFYKLFILRESVQHMPCFHLRAHQDASDLGMPAVLASGETEDRVERTGTQNSSVGRSEDGLTSYDLAHRHGTRVQSFKKQIMMSSSDVVGSSRGLEELDFFYRMQRRCAMLVKSSGCELFFALIIPGIGMIRVLFRWR